MLIMTGLIHKWNKRGKKKIESDDINMGKRWKGCMGERLDKERIKKKEGGGI